MGMRSYQPLKIAFIMVAALLLSTVMPPLAQGGVNATYLYNLSDFTGVVRHSLGYLYADRASGEVYVADSDGIRIYNEAGMMTYRFGDDPELGSVYGISVDETGDIYTLSFDLTRPGTWKIPPYYLARCNYRGEPKEKIQISNLPPGFSGFYPNRVVYGNGRFYLANLTQMKVVVTDKKGVFERGYDLADIVGIEEKDRTNVEFFGFSLDEAGNMYVTIPVRFKVCRISPDGKAEMFGKSGSNPGSFGVVSGVAVDRDGNIFVTDKLKDAVMMFDKSFRFLTQFGSRQVKGGGLAVPTDLVVGKSGQLYVTQMRNRGVSVFSVSSN